MEVIVDLYSNSKHDIEKFLSKFFGTKIEIADNLKWRKVYQNPIQATNIIGVFIDNKDNFDINMWVSLDKDFFINITDYNADKIIRYLFERYPCI